MPIVWGIMEAQLTRKIYNFYNLYVRSIYVTPRPLHYAVTVQSFYISPPPFSERSVRPSRHSFRERVSDKCHL